VKLRPRSTRLGFLVLLLAVALAAGFPATVGAAPGVTGTRMDAALAKKLKDSARGSVKISVNDATSFASFIRAGRNGDLLPSSTAVPQGKAKGFIRQFGALFGVAAPTDLVQISAVTDAYGATHLTYAQTYKGLSVFGGTLKAHVDKAGNLTAVNGTAVPNISLSTDPRLSAADAKARAIATVKADPPGGSVDGGAKVGKLRTESTELVVYRTGLVKGEAGTNELAYHVVVTNGASIRDAVFVDAMTGKVINRYTLVDNALYRVLYESSPNTKPIWEEGDRFPGRLNQDQQNIVNFTGQAYRFFFNAFSRDSYDAAGAHMRSVNNDPRISCPNANWNGVTTNYCNGVTPDDVVAHEWGHAYTEYTHNLIYQWQPGALNESYSDIWGETVDLINGVGSDSPGGTRGVGLCSTFSAQPAVVINSPASIAQTCPAGTATFGPAVTTTGTTGNIILALDEANTSGPTTNDACTALTNAGAIAGNIALVYRGTCGFTVKVKNAQNAGAIGVVVSDNVAGGVAGMGGTDATITIPSLRITLAHGDLIKNTLAAGSTVNVSLKMASAPGAQDSYRWLMGEDSSAFRGAIRDMWNPNCYGDPGKVTDAQYICDSSDGGGVHSNSGVPNHGYALLVDGGTFNGRTVTGLGLVKAAHIYWRAQSVYQDPMSKFPDHADALEASCTDLIGQNLESLSTGTDLGPSGESLSAADCLEVTDMIAAVELRTDPTAQCNFGPALDQNTPLLCPREKDPIVVFNEDFEGGFAGWTRSNTGVYSGWGDAPTDWDDDSSLPGGRAGTAAFAAGPDVGDCGAGDNDISGVMRLESPAILIPASSSPRVSFDHYFATEAAFDGGNVKISVNGGAFEVIPAAAFTFNPYNGTLATVAAGSTNPLAGQPGFSGTDGGELTGTWGTSQILLAAAGVDPGDTIKLRFDFGRDGCGGNDGWYVDDVQVVACKLRGKP